jgi:hypothetical protein
MTISARGIGKTVHSSDQKLPRGQLLIMSGDEVYPLTNAQTYRNQLLQPYRWAFPDPDRKDPNGVPCLPFPATTTGMMVWYSSSRTSRQRALPISAVGARIRSEAILRFSLQRPGGSGRWIFNLAEDMDQPQAD